MIEVEKVTKRFGPLVAVNGVSFALVPDEIVGFVGPNGAGKSTVLRMLAGFLHPTAGEIRFEGRSILGNPTPLQRRLGYLPGDTPLYLEMRADRFLQFIGKAHGLRGPKLRERFQWVVENCGLESALRKRVKECSTGFRKRLGLGAALIHDPDVLFLDEPTHGLDPLQMVAFRSLLERLRPGRVILLSSHVIPEISGLSDRLLVIHDGRLLADGSLADLRRRQRAPQASLEELFLTLIRRARDGAPSPPADPEEVNVQ